MRTLLEVPVCAKCEIQVHGAAQSQYNLRVSGKC